MLFILINVRKYSSFCSLVDRVLCCDVPSQAIYYQDVVPAVVCSEVEVQSVAWKDVEHISMRHLHRVLFVTLKC